MKRHGHLLKGWTQSFHATRYKGVGLRKVHTLLMGIVVLFTALGIAHSQERLQIRFEGSATLSVEGGPLTCGVLIACPYDRHYCRSWNLCQQGGTRTIAAPGSYLLLGGTLGEGSYFGRASLTTNLEFIFTYRPPGIRIEGYQYTPKTDLGFLYFVDRVWASAFANAGASCWHLDGCCSSASASATASAVVWSSLVGASASSTRSASCSCASTDPCRECTSESDGARSCDPTPCGSGRRGFKANAVRFDSRTSTSVAHAEKLSAQIDLSASVSSVHCASLGNIGTARADAGVVVQSAPHPLGVPAIGENEYVWSASSPATLAIPASALGYTWGWEDEQTDADRDGLDDDWGSRNGLGAGLYSADPTRTYTDNEVPALIHEYGAVRRHMDTWKSDWATCGLQAGEPSSPFPWFYLSGGRRFLNPPRDYLTEI